MSIPGMLSLGGGYPNVKTFPYAQFSCTLQDGTKLELTHAETQSALQYSLSQGFPQLVDWIREYQRVEHGPAYGDWDVCLGTGSQDVLTRALEMLLEPGDSVLVEDSSYPGTLAFLQPRGNEIIPVGTDTDGLIPEELVKVLDTNTARKRPRVLVTIPTGQNPAGTTVPLRRRKEIMEIASARDLLIIEDDPYYYLNFGDYPLPPNPQRQAIPSLFSMDTEGRVLRTDSLSKVLSSGIRIGWLTAHREFIERVVFSIQCTTVCTSAVSQAMIYKLLEEWGVAGFQKHLDDTAVFYGKRRDVMEGLCAEHLTGLCTWRAPSAGLFYWFNTRFNDTKELIETKARDEKVLMVPGTYFKADGGPSSFVRAAFSSLDDESLTEAVKRFGRVLA